MIKTRFNGREIWLYLSGQAMFEINEIEVAWNDGHVDRISGVAELMSGTDPARGEVLAAVVEILERAALAAKRAMQQDGFEVVPAGEILALAKPKDVLALRNAVLFALRDGYATDAEHNQTVDVFMLENKKKRTGLKAKRNT